MAGATPGWSWTCGTGARATSCPRPDRPRRAARPGRAAVRHRRRGHLPGAGRRPAPAGPGGRRRPPHARRLPGRPAAGRGRGRAVRVGAEGPEVGATLVAKRDAAVRRSALPAAAALARRRPVAPRRDRHAAPGRDPAGQQPALRAPGLPGGRQSTACSSTSRRRRRWCAPGPTATRSASPPRRSTPRRCAPGPTPCRRPRRDLGALRRALRRPGAGARREAWPRDLRGGDPAAGRRPAGAVRLPGRREGRRAALATPHSGCGTSSATSRPTPRPPRWSPRWPARATPTSRSARCAGWSSRSTGRPHRRGGGLAAGPAARLGAAAQPAARRAGRQLRAGRPPRRPPRRLDGAGRRGTTARRRPTPQALQRQMLAAVGRRPRRPAVGRPAGQGRARRGPAAGGRPPAGLPPRHPLARRPRPRRRAGRRGGRRRAGRHRRRRPHRGAGARRRRAAGRRRRLPAGGHRAGQDRRARAELRQRRRRRLRRRAGRPLRPRGARPQQRHPGGRGPHADLPRGGLGGRRRAAPRGQGRRPGAHRRRARRLLPAVGQHLGVPGAAEDAPGRRRPRPGPRLRRGAVADGVAGRRPARLRRRGAGDAPAGGGQHPGRPGRPGAQARPRRAARRRVRRPAAAAGARPGRPDAARRRHAAGAAGAVGQRLRRPGRRRDADRLLPLPAHRRAPAAAAAAAPHPPAAHRRAAAALAGPLAGLQARPARRRRRRAATPSWRCTPARCAGCTRSSSTARCCRRWPGCPPSAASWAPRPPATGCARSASPTRRGRCGTWRALTGGRLPLGVHAEVPAAGGAADLRRLPQPRRRACSPTGRSARRSAATSGSCGCCATRARWPSGSRSCSAPASTSRGCSPGRRRRCGCWPTTTSSSRARRPRSPTRGGRRPAGPATRRPGIRVLRGLRRQELLRVACADLLGRLDVLRVGRGADRHRRRHAAGRPGRRRARARRGDRHRRSTRPADGPGRHRHGPARRRRDGLRLRRRRPVRAPRARAGADEATATAAANAVAHTLRRLLGEPAPDPAFEVDADLRPGGPPGRAGPQPVGVPRVLRALGVGVGGAGAAAGGRRSPGTRQLGAGVRRDGRADPLPRRRADRRPGRRDPPDQGAGGAGAAAPRRRPGHPHQARPRRAGRRRVDRPAAAAAARRRRAAAAGPPDGRRRCGALVDAGHLDAEQADALRVGLGAGHAGPQRGLPGARPAQRPAAPAGRGAGRASRGPAAYGADVDPGQFLDDYRRTTRHARTVVDHVFYGQARRAG